MSQGAREKAPRPGRGDVARANDTSDGKYVPRLNVFLPLDLSDFEAKDNDLTDTEHLIFLRLVKQFWLTACALPKSDTKLARIARVSVTEWRRNRDTVLAYFIETPEGFEPDIYRQALERAQNIAEKRREAGQKGGQISGRKRQANASENASKAQARRAQAVRGTDTNYYPSGGPQTPDAPTDGDRDGQLSAVAGGAA